MLFIAWKCCADRSDTRQIAEYIEVCKKQYKTILGVVLFSLLISGIGLLGSMMFEYVVNGVYSGSFFSGNFSVEVGKDSPMDVMLLRLIVGVVPSFVKLVVRSKLVYNGSIDSSKNHAVSVEA